MASNRTRKARGPVVFVRVGWMEFYGFLPEDGGPVGGGSYNLENRGSEVDNFARASDRRCYGYYQPAHGARGFNLGRIDPRTQGSTVDGVLVVIFARDPNHGGQRVVGWYQDARCHAGIKKRNGRSYLFDAESENCVLLPSWYRIDGPMIPTGKGGTGRANVLYSFDPRQEPINRKWVDDTVRWIGRYSGPNMLRDAAARPVERPSQEPSRRGTGGGGEGPAHKRLKQYVAENPDSVGLPRSCEANIEYGYASGDCVDIKFNLPGGKAAVVEIETDHPWPGAHQCIKYRALLEAERGDPLNGGSVKALLVAHKFDEETLAFAKRYGITTVALGPDVARKRR